MADRNWTRLENVILQSGKDFSIGLSAKSNRQNQNSFTVLPLTDSGQSSERAKQLEALQPRLFVIVLDEQLLEILESKRSRKLFALISGIVKQEDVNLIIVQYGVADDAQEEFLNDLGHCNPDVILVKSEDGVGEIASRLSRYLLPVSKEAIESEEHTGYIINCHSSLNSSSSNNSTGPYLTAAPNTGNSSYTVSSVRKSPEGRSLPAAGSNNTRSEGRVPQAVESYNSFDSSLSSPISSEKLDTTELFDSTELPPKSGHEKDKAVSPPGNPTVPLQSVPHNKKPEGKEKLSVEIPEKGEKQRNLLQINNQSGNLSAYGNSSSAMLQDAQRKSSVDDQRADLSNLKLEDDELTREFPHLYSNLTSYVRQDFVEDQTLDNKSSSITCAYCGNNKDMYIRAAQPPYFGGPLSFSQGNNLGSFGPPALSYHSMPYNSICGECISRNHQSQQHQSIPKVSHNTNPQDNRQMDGLFPITGQRTGVECSTQGQRSRNSDPVALPQPQTYLPSMRTSSSAGDMSKSSVKQSNQAVRQSGDQANNRTMYERAHSEPFPQGLLQQPFSFNTFPYGGYTGAPQQPLNDINLPLRPEILQLQQLQQLQQQLFYRNIHTPAGSVNLSDPDNTRQQSYRQSSGHSVPNTSLAKVPVKPKQKTRPPVDIPNPSLQHEVGPSYNRVNPVTPINEAAGGASAADADGDICIMQMSQPAMEHIQTNMDYASSNFNWEKLAHLHGWSFGMIQQLKQKWHKRQVESPFIELLGTERFQNYTLRQLKEDLNKIPRKDILEKIREFEDDGTLIAK